jgi:endoglucanase
MDTFALLKKLSETPGPSGDEEGIAAVIADLWRPLVDEITTDRVGSLLARKRGTANSTQHENGGDGHRQPVVLLAAHMDEIGLMVSQIEASHGAGFVRVSRVGGVDNRHLYGQTVVIHGRRPLIGVIGCLPAFLLPEERRNNAFSYEDLVVDPGLTIEELRQQVSIGDFVSFRQPLRKLQGNQTSGKALDNRASVAAVTVCLEQLRGRLHHWDVIAAATSQEETRLLGAYTSGHSQQPDVAIAIDVTHGKGAHTNDALTFELGSGPSLGIGPNVHPGVFQALRDAAGAMEMSVTIEPHSAGSGTDAYGLQIARAGIPTGLISIPLKYMHTMVETVDLADVERTGRLLAEFIIRLNDQFLDKLSAVFLDENEK